jgi:hypothetical protein
MPARGNTAFGGSIGMGIPIGARTRGDRPMIALSLQIPIWLGEDRPASAACPSSSRRLAPAGTGRLAPSQPAVADGLAAPLQVDQNHVSLIEGWGGAAPSRLRQARTMLRIAPTPFRSPEEEGLPARLQRDPRPTSGRSGQADLAGIRAEPEPRPLPGSRAPAPSQPFMTRCAHP